MIRLEELMDLEELGRELDAGYVNLRDHPEFPQLAILNYSEKCQYENYWTAVTRQTRGLIYNSDTMEVVARPFAKFFNYGDERNGTASIDLDAPILGAFDKMDGSLGIGYIRPDGKAAVATRGSFESDQAIHATETLTDEVADAIHAHVEFGYTPLFEIVYPENRIVLDYGDRDELAYLGSVNMRTGMVGLLEYSKLRAEASTFREVLELPNRDNAEGYVVWIDPWTAVKIKQEDYVELHKLVTGLNRKSVWRALADGTYQEMAMALPDEFYDWAQEVAGNLVTEHHLIEWEVDLLMASMGEEDMGSATRKEQALWIQAHARPEVRGLMFARLDGKPISDKVWKMIEPSGAER